MHDICYSLHDKVICKQLFILYAYIFNNNCRLTIKESSSVNKSNTTITAKYSYYLSSIADSKCPICRLLIAFRSYYNNSMNWLFIIGHKSYFILIVSSCLSCIHQDLFSSSILLSCFFSQIAPSRKTTYNSNFIFDDCIQKIDIVIIATSLFIKS